MEIYSINQGLDEIERLCSKERKSVHEAIEIVKKKLKTQPASMSNEHVDIINSIIAPGENIDNGVVYSEATGETIRDLI